MANTGILSFLKIASVSDSKNFAMVLGHSWMLYSLIPMLSLSTLICVLLRYQSEHLREIAVRYVLGP